MRNEFMQFKQLNDSVTELHIYGDIRKVSLFEKIVSKNHEIDIDSTSAVTFKEALKSVETDTLIVRINSGGGSVMEALAIYNQLRDFSGKLVTKVDGFAASAASVIFMAGEERVVPNSSLLMIHNAWTFGEGNANEFRKMADDLDKITQPSVNIYVEKTGQSEELIKNLMDNETWITSQEAKDLGFATDTTEDDPNMSYQQSALLSLVKENRALKEKMQEITMTIDYEKIAETVFKKMAIEPDNDSHSNWNGFFNQKKEGK